MLLGVVAAASAGDAEIVSSNLVYRLVVGMIVFGVAYALIAVLWHAWHRKTLQKGGVGPASLEAPDQTVEIRTRDAEVQEFMETATDVVDDLEKRLRKQEEGGDGA